MFNDNIKYLLCRAGLRELIKLSPLHYNFPIYEFSSVPHSVEYQWYYWLRIQLQKSELNYCHWLWNKYIWIICIYLKCIKLYHKVALCRDFIEQFGCSCYQFKKTAIYNDEIQINDNVRCSFYILKVKRRYIHLFIFIIFICILQIFWNNI